MPACPARTYFGLHCTISTASSLLLWGSSSSGSSLQELHYLSVTMIGGNHQGSTTIFVYFLEVCAGFQQGLDYLGVSVATIKGVLPSLLAWSLLAPAARRASTTSI